MSAEVLQRLIEESDARIERLSSRLEAIRHNSRTASKYQHEIECEELKREALIKRLSNFYESN